MIILQDKSCRHDIFEAKYRKKVFEQLPLFLNKNMYLVLVCRVWHSLRFELSFRLVLG